MSAGDPGQEILVSVVIEDLVFHHKRKSSDAQSNSYPSEVPIDAIGRIVGSETCGLTSQVVCCGGSLRHDVIGVRSFLGDVDSARCPLEKRV
jgi:hypothetical protein